VKHRTIGIYKPLEFEGFIRQAGLNAFTLSPALSVVKYYENRNKSVYTKTLLKTVSAFANYHDGVIIVGIDDQKQIVGIKNPDELRLNLENAINDAIDPRPYYESEVETYAGEDILLIRV